MKFDVLVYGGNSAAVMAAVSAARLGKNVLLASPGGHLGGLSSGGLGATDLGIEDAVGGMARDFYAALGRHYGEGLAWRFEPHLAERYFEDLVRGAGLVPWRGCRLAGVKKQGPVILQVSFEDGRQVEASCYIDCTYEADLMAQAGVSYTVGREAVAQYGEDLNGIRAESHSHQFRIDVDPYVKAGDPASGLLPCIQSGDGGKPGAADKLVQAYNFRLCLTQEEKNRLPILPAPGYDRARYALLGRTLQALQAAGKTPRFTDLFLIVRMPQGKTDFNNNGFFSTDHLGASWDYPEAGPAARGLIWADHEAYIRGIFHYLNQDPDVPASIRRDALSWGLCRDEFLDTGGWPHQLYVREGRRMLGSYVVTQADCQGKVKVEDAVGMGSYTMDSHHCQRVVQGGFVRNEGDVQVGLDPYPISYRALTPRAAECENLLVPVCLSATHIAYGSIRMEPVFMQLGQAAGAAAAQAVEGRKAVQAIDVSKLQRDLRQAGAVLEFKGKKTEGWAHDNFVVK